MVGQGVHKNKVELPQYYAGLKETRERKKLSYLQNKIFHSVSNTFFCSFLDAQCRRKRDRC